MAYARYDPYTDKWIYEDSQTSTVATVSISKEPIRTYQLTELTDECIDKIADAVVQKLRAEQTEPKTDWHYDEQDSTWYPYKHKDEPKTEPNCSEKPNNCEDEPQTDIHDLTDCDFCKERNCKDCEGGKDEPQTERSE